VANIESAAHPRNPRTLLPWIIGLALLALVLVGLALSLDESNRANPADGAAAVRSLEATPRALRQMAALPAAGRAAA